MHVTATHGPVESSRFGRSASHSPHSTSQCDISAKWPIARSITGRLAVKSSVIA